MELKYRPSVYYADWAGKQREAESIADLSYWIDEETDTLRLDLTRTGKRPHMALEISKHDVLAIFKLAREKEWIP